MKKLESWKQHSGWNNGFYDRAIALKKLYKDIMGNYIGDVSDIGCGTKKLKEILPHRSYTGYDLIGDPDVKIDINKLVLKNADIIIGLGILEYINATEFLDNHLDTCNLLICSYNTKDKHPNNREANWWINSYSLEELKNKIGEHREVDGYDFFIRKNK